MLLCTSDILIVVGSAQYPLRFVKVSVSVSCSSLNLTFFDITPEGA